MFDSPIIEVIIGLIFVFSLMSIIITQLNTVSTSLLNTRSKHLKRGIEEMITDPVVQAKFMAHPLIRMIPPEITPNDTISAQTAVAATQSEPLKLTAIPKELFTQTLLDILSANASNNIYSGLNELIEYNLKGSEKAQMRELSRQLQNSGIGIDEFRAEINQLADPMDRQKLNAALSRVDSIRKEINADNEKSKLIPLLAGVRQIQDNTFRYAMETLLSSAQNVDDARFKIDFWFTTRMTELSDSYKRNIQYLSFGLGLLLTLMLNIDALHLARSFWDDPSVRTAINTAAITTISDGTLQQNTNTAGSTQTSNETLEQPQAESTQEPSASGNLGNLATMSVDVQRSIDNLLALRLPIGWEFTIVEEGCTADEAGLVSPRCDDKRNAWNFLPGNNPSWLTLLIVKFIGWGITAVAISQGAPFWFDLLNRLARGGN